MNWKSNLPNFLYLLTFRKDGYRKRLYVFIICILFSSAFWLQIKFSKTYSLTIEHPLIFINVPKNKVLVNQLNKNLVLNVKEKGFQLLTYKFLKSPVPLLIDMTKLKKITRNDKIFYYLPVNKLLNNLSRQLDHKSELVSIIPDTIFCELDDIIHKKVPIKLNLNVSYEKQYGLYDKIVIKPDSIYIIGSKNLLKNVNELSTKLINLKNLNSNYSSSVPLNLLNTNQVVDYSSKSVNLKFIVEKFTGGSVIVPITGIKCPEGYKLKTFPETITVDYQVAFRDYQKIKSNQFVVVADYSTLENLSNSTIELKILKSPPTVKFVRTNIKKAEYILIKKQ